MCLNVRVIDEEEAALQHRLLVGDLRVSIPLKPKRVCTTQEGMKATRPKGASMTH